MDPQKCYLLILLLDCALQMLKFDLQLIVLLLGRGDLRSELILTDRKFIDI